MYQPLQHRWREPHLRLLGAPVQQDGNGKNAAQDPLPTYEEYDGHHINDLRAELRSRGLAATGNQKRPLINALMTADGNGNKGNDGWKSKPVLKRKRDE